MNILKELWSGTLAGTNYFIALTVFLRGDGKVTLSYRTAWILGGQPGLDHVDLRLGELAYLLANVKGVDIAGHLESIDAELGRIIASQAAKEAKENDDAWG